MSTASACFENVIGLSQTGCECFTTDMPADADVSRSGLYLDQTPGLNLARVFAGQGCEDTGWDILTKAVEEGALAFNNRVLSQVKLETKWRRQPVRSQIGDIKGGTATVTLPKVYHGVELMLADHVGGTATVKRIGTYVKFTGSIDVSVYEEGNDSPLYTYTVTTTNNKLVWTDIEPLVLDMDAEGSPNKRYWFLFEPTGGQQALNSRIHCGCAGKPNWSSSHPWYESAIGMDGMAWSAWSMCMGTYGDTLADREDWTHNNATQGLLLDVDFKCDAKSVLCSGEPDYQGDPIQQVYAWGVRWEAALWIINYLVGSTRVNRDAIAGGDELQQLMVSYMAKAKEFGETMAALLTEEGEGQRSGVNTYSDCFTCKDRSGIRVQTIRR